MAVTTFDTGAREITVKDLIARGVYSVIALLEGAAYAVADYRSRRATAAQLYALSDEMLADIGLTRDTIDEALARR
ncbi:MAG: DUF1127 domain-containing protein [Alphaproteobacteria bacterium]|jgi:uncharacterized protein YjiS (DUF1127 family)|uniref:DUF1127 domain-containing protein n=1 Tax=Pacificispira sp. TaxID=2888761 RepID=UPI001B1E5460|nr:DUF1127 domain-containing protein [Alphaproteobacteria bacterium]MBO6863059.1 DUF1127 domain-containing protein [Alphaproteobacteria bacterium]MEC9266360.1 DUF1127 domain-containing protein [Pseudomonadota bacterium]